MEEIAVSMYADNLISGGYKKEEVIGRKEIATKYFMKMSSHCISGTLILVSNPAKTTMKQFNIATKSQGSQAHTSDKVLAKSGNIIPNVNREVSYQVDTTFAKQQLSTKSRDTIILGVYWNENEDTSIAIPKSKGKYANLNILSHLASIYDPLGFSSSVHILGKIVHRISCELKL